MATIKTNIGENLFDIASRIYSHPLGVFWLMEDNGFDSIIKEFTEVEILQVRDEKVTLLDIGNVIFRKRKLPKYSLRNRQSFFDVVIENQGTMAGVFDLQDVNNMDGITEHLYVDEELTVLEETDAPRIRESLSYYMPIATIDEGMKADGIGFMRVEKNFIVR